jgi:hypothetical protein
VTRRSGVQGGRADGLPAREANGWDALAQSMDEQLRSRRAVTQTEPRKLLSPEQRFALEATEDTDDDA